MHPSRRAFGHLFQIAPSLDDLRQVPGARASEAACLREAPEPGPSRPRQPDAADAAIGALIRTTRRRLGLHQGDVARALEVSTSMVHIWEAGREPVPPQRIGQLAQALGLAAEALTPADHLARDADERALLAWFRGLAAGDRQSLLARLA